jgi:putative transcription factor
MLVCGKCQKLGKPYQEEPQAPRMITSRRPNFQPRVSQRRMAELPKEMDELEVSDNFSELVRKHRMKLGLSQEDLAKRVKEKLSVIQKIETGKMAPDSRLCRELEHELKVKILVPRKETIEVPKSAAPKEVTLGDIMRVKGKAKTEL